ncbi:MAG: chlorite dismutase family protein [Candidatus Omnitrophica bacterium]|nr:chlorite dismutase family protein [Candidatus Omnitrophota bacterium]MBI2496004.1 chlorite dismutase family protein [Candidatus Omnitrophota bacterium]MBI3020463.1 chlorite dismutase family protein [Candidatus Omnitrophota bacterium]MBI3083915.1 chlorite dismutase family protein [Candidatus Omnitrophota bacterium]
MTTTTRVETQPQATTASAQGRQVVGFSFYRVDPAWRRLPGATKRKQADELCGVVNTYAKRLMVLTYSLVGMKADTDFLIWRVGTSLDQLQEMSGAVRRTELAGYLSMPYAYLSVTKRSTYVDKLDPEHQDQRRFIRPANSKYLFVYPFVKTRDWYLLPMEQRQGMMDEHIRIGSKYPSVRLHTTYSFGLDDQEFVVAFESDTPQDFLDLVMELRESQGSRYTLRDTPIFTCVAKPMPEIAKDFGTPP